MKVDTASERSLLIATDLSRAYRGGKGVFDIHLRLGAGEVLGVMGPNGSGKTTLLRLLATAATPTAGQVSWFGSSNARDPSVRGRLGVMLDQAAHFDQMTGYQNAWFFAHQFGLSDGLASWPSTLPNRARPGPRKRSTPPSWSGWGSRSATAIR